MSPSLYFAYGSNLSLARLADRVPSAVSRGIARAPGFALRIDKLGADGSAKANLHPISDDAVWGALYGIDPRHWDALDACESGYARIEIEVWQGDALLRAQTYRSERLTCDPVPFAWYKRLIVDGAHEHGLPEAWLERLAALPARESADASD